MIDITRPLGPETASWPGDTPFEIDWTLDLDRGDSCSVSRLVLSPHTGTHADAPAHYLEDGATTETFDLDAFIGPVRVLDARGAELGLDWFRSQGALGETRLLVRTLERTRPDRFAEGCPPLDPDAARALVDAGLRTFGTDAPSVDPVDSTTLAAHRALGAGGVAILENLDLERAAAGRYDLVALPVRLIGADAAPVRAVLFPAGTLAREGAPRG